MRPSPVLVLVIGCALVLAFPVLLLAVSPSNPAAPAPIPACSAAPYASYPIQVLPGQDTLLGSVSANATNPYGGPPPQWRLSIWSNSSASYGLFLLTLDQYGSFVASNGTGFNGSVLHGAPLASYWSSGTVDSTNETLLMGNGTWFMLLYDPGSTEITVSVLTATCNAP